MEGFPPAAPSHLHRASERTRAHELGSYRRRKHRFPATHSGACRWSRSRLHAGRAPGGQAAIKVLASALRAPVERNATKGGLTVADLDVRPQIAIS